MEKITYKTLTGERALFNANELEIENCTFEDGESPLKESSNINIKNTMFKWKYPVWYSNNVKIENCTLFETARSGIWYTNNISIKNSQIEAPKTFRRCNDITLEYVSMPNASETFWNCSKINLDNVNVKGDYFAMNSTDIKISNFEITGNYPFDGGKNIEIRNAKLLSKDAFWNCENVIVYDSFIKGEYLGWNSKNVTFVNCTIESLQGMCYMDGIILKNCQLINTSLAFEYSVVDAVINGEIDGVFNPTSGKIEAKHIKELILDETKISPSKTKIITEVDKVAA